MPLTGEAKKAYQRTYMRGRSNKNVQKAADRIGEVLAPYQGGRHALTPYQEELANAALALALRSKDIDLDRIAGKLHEKLDSKRIVNINGVPTEVEDNDAQLRALEFGYKVLGDAGMAPSTRDRQGNGNTITVNVLSFRTEAKSVKDIDLA